MTEHRKLNPRDISLPAHYEIEVFAQGLDAPISMVFTDSGDMIIADAGVIDGNGKVLKLTKNGITLIADGFQAPLTGINHYMGNIYVSHRGIITVIRSDGKREDILTGLPSLGDHHNNQVVFGPDGKMYFGQGSATNSGVVGLDNQWLREHPFFHDYPGTTIRLTGQNFITEDIFTISKTDETATGVFSPFRVPTTSGEKVKGICPPGASILRANPDGSELELIAWGLRNPFRLKFDRTGRLFATNHGMGERGSRPVANSPDEFHRILPGVWYGWPDYTGGYPITMPQFKSHGKPPLQFVLAKHPMKPPKPIVNFTPHSAAMGFDFNPNSDFGPIGNVFVAEFGESLPGTPRAGHMVSRLDVKTRTVEKFAVNRSGVAASLSGDGGFERPIDAVFSPNGELFIVDMGINVGKLRNFIPGTGVVWRIKSRF